LDRNELRSYEIDLKLIQMFEASVRQAVEQKHGRAYRKQETREETVELKGDIASQWQLIWIEHWRGGRARLNHTKSAKVAVPFQICERLELRVVQKGKV
jgi:hypothetical protein